MGNDSNANKKKKNGGAASSSLWWAKAGLYSVGGLAAMSGLYIASRWWDSNHHDKDGSHVEPPRDPLPPAPLDTSTHWEYEMQAFVAQSGALLRKLVEEVLTAKNATQRQRERINRIALSLWFDREAHQSAGGGFQFNPEAFKRAVQDHI